MISPLGGTAARAERVVLFTVPVAPMRNAQPVVTPTQLYELAMGYVSRAEIANAQTHALGYADPGFWEQTFPERQENRRIRDAWSAAGGNWFGSDAEKVPIAAAAVKLAVSVREGLPGAPADIPPEVVAAAGLTETQLTAPLPPMVFSQDVKEQSALGLGLGALLLVALGFYFLDRSE